MLNRREFTPGPSGTMFFSNGGMTNVNPRKRVRETAPVTADRAGGGLFSRSLATPPGYVNLGQLQTPPMVSTGLRLAFEGQNQNHGETNFSSFVPQEMVVQQREEMEQLLVAQAEQLRRALSERWQQQYRTMLAAAEEAAAYRLQEKEAESQLIAQRTAELEDRLSRLRAETLAWQSKAMADHATATSLQAQLQQIAANTPPARQEESGESPDVDDAESVANVEPRKVERERACRGCRRRMAEVVLLPCRHLCMCGDCDTAAAAGGDGCAVCGCERTGSVQVYLS